MQMDKYFKNQKGFIIAPVILWIVGVLVLTGTVAVEQGLISVNLSGKEIECPEGTVKTQFGNNFECLTKKEPALPIPTSKSSPTPTPIRTPAPKPVQQVVPTIDLDPIINCNFPQSGTKKIRRSECSKSFDCQIGGQWYIYTDRNKCSEDQKNYWAKVYSPPTTDNSNIPSSQLSKPTVNCVLSYGTYRWLESDCENAKKRDEEDQKRQEERNVQSAVNQLEKQVVQYQQEEQRKADLEACLKKGNEDKNRALDVEKQRQIAQQANTGNAPTDMITKQILQNWGAIENQCHASYGY